MDHPSIPGAETRWRAHAACADDDHTSYFDGRRRHPRCDTCPAAEPCLWFGLATEQTAGYRYGCWGGTTAGRRARIATNLPDVNLTPWYLQVALSWTPPAPRSDQAP